VTFFPTPPPPLPSGVADLEPGQAEELLRRGEVRVLDVREPAEHIASHIPGAVLIPLGLLERRFGELDPGAAWLVHSGHGVRSTTAARFLRERGFRSLHHLAGGLSRWQGARADHSRLFEDMESVSPNRWLLRHLPVLPRGRALDVAGGRGRNALALAQAGWEVEVVDHSPERLDEARARAGALNLPVRTRCVDLEATADPLPKEAFELVVVVHYLHRELFPALKAALRPGGAIVYETFTREQARFGKPRSPDHLLETGELREVFAGWEVLAEREGQAGPDGRLALRMVASIVARRPEEGG